LIVKLILMLMIILKTTKNLLWKILF